MFAELCTWLNHRVHICLQKLYRIIERKCSQKIYWIREKECLQKMYPIIERRCSRKCTGLLNQLSVKCYDEERSAEKITAKNCPFVAEQTNNKKSVQEMNLLTREIEEKKMYRYWGLCICASKGPARNGGQSSDFRFLFLMEYSVHPELYYLFSSCSKKQNIKFIYKP